MIATTLCRATADTELRHADATSQDSAGVIQKNARHRFRRLLKSKIEYIANASFEEGDLELELFADPSDLPAESAGNGQASPLPANMPPHFARLCCAALLTPARERTLFRRMNYLKHRAVVLRDSIDPLDIDMDVLAEAELCLAQANAARDEIVRANVRLVMSIVKRFASPQHAFDNLLSDGIMVLLRAVEKFDYQRGFRFSTYAYRAVAREAYHSVVHRQKELRSLVSHAEEMLDVRGPAASTPEAGAALEAKSAVLAGLLGHLDRRERFIIRSRYALGAHRKAQTFRALAKLLGVSKERVRQLEQRAMLKLRRLAAELPPEALERPPAEKPETGFSR